jgi:hypothetical protein
MKKFISKKSLTNAANGLSNLPLPEATPIKLNEFRDALLRVLGIAAIPQNGRNEVTIGRSTFDLNRTLVINWDQA